MMTEAHYKQYVSDFNAACAGDSTAISEFYKTYFDPNAIFEYILNATKNVGKDMTVSFWKMCMTSCTRKLKTITR